MRRALSNVAAAAITTAVLLVATPMAPAHACSVVPPASVAEIHARLTGQPYQQDDAWLPQDLDVTGFVEYAVAHEWEATLDYTAASARVATRTWGTVDGRLLHGQALGGEPRGPFVEFSTCGPSRAAPLGQITYSVIFEGAGGHPVEGALDPDLESVLLSTLGEPSVLELPEFDDRHPGYDRQAFGWQSYATWGRIAAAGAAVLFIPVAAFGAWLYSTRRD